jgi:hypothetical protein
MNTSKSLLKIQNTIFDYVIFLSYFLYFCALLGISSSAPEYLETLQYWTKIYVSIFLIIRFNMFRKISFNYLDQKIAFHAGIFLLATTVIQQLLERYLNKIKKIL